MGDSEGDSRDTIADCWKEALVEEMLHATNKCTFERALKRGREGFIVAFAVTGIEYWVLSKIWDDPTIIGHQPRQNDTASSTGSSLVQSLLSWKSFTLSKSSSGSRRPHSTPA